MADKFTLQEGQGIDENLRPVRLNGENTSLEIATEGAKVKGDLEVTGNIHNVNTNRIVSTGRGLEIQVAGDITLRPAGGELYIHDGSNNIVTFSTGGRFQISDDTQIANYFRIEVSDHGETTLTTMDSDAAIAHLNIEVDGHVEFDGCAVGFDKETTTFAAAAVTSEGNDSTDIDFRLGNKHELTLSDNIAGSGEYINMIFPATSGNFILTVCQDAGGGNTVAAGGWRAYASDASLADNELAASLTDGNVRWAGATAPTLSTGARAVDVISIYWDADNQTALAVASLNFAAP